MIDMSNVFAGIFNPFVIGLIIMAIGFSVIKIYYKKIVEPKLKGHMGELQTQAVNHLHLNKKKYKQINDVLLKVMDHTTQIDHLIISQYGIFVIETKNMQGWIFGGMKSKQWTQKIFNNSYSFQNPIHQNYKHIKVLQELLDIPEDNFISIVYFNQGELKSDIFKNVFDNKEEYIDYIKSFQEIVLSEGEVENIINIIRENQIESTRETKKHHVQSLKDRFSIHHSQNICPKCGNQLILRTARRGKNAGSQFYGCSKYPLCKYTRNI